VTELAGHGQSYIDFYPPLGSHGIAKAVDLKYSEGETDLSRDTTTDSDRQLMDEWLKKNEVTVCPPCQRTDPENINFYTWGRRPKKKKVPAKKTSPK
jgi:hypothetical protein